MAQPVPQQNDLVFESREARLEWERARIAEAEADFAAGRFLEGDAALDWLDRWAAGEELVEPDVT
jgi:predicted transcriptional regulator